MTTVKSITVTTTTPVSRMSSSIEGHTTLRVSSMIPLMRPDCTNWAAICSRFCLLSARELLDITPSSLQRRTIPASSRGGTTRTRDPRFWRPMLYQLSYAPVLPSSFIVPFRYVARPGWDTTSSHGVQYDYGNVSNTSGAPYGPDRCACFSQ